MAKMIPLKFNDPAPDVEVLTLDGQPVRLSSFWQASTLVLAFARHFGCPQCKEMLDRLAALKSEFASRGLAIAVVTQGTPDVTKTFCEAHAPGITCLSDTQRAAYRAYGLKRATWFQSFSARVMSSNRRLKREKGWSPKLPPKGQDAFQMSGLFIIGTDGRIRLPYYYDDIADHPGVDLLFRGVMGADWTKPFDSPIQPE
jgi:peroxiredoxin